MKGILLIHKKHVIFSCFILLSVFFSACSGITPTEPAVNSFTADTYILEEGESAILSWTTTDADAVTLNPGSLTVALSGSTPVSPSTTTIYTLTATNSAGTSSVTITIVVNPAIVEQTMILPLDSSSGKDIDVNKRYPDTRFNTYQLLIGNGSDPDLVIRSYLQFDLSTIPANATIVSAELKLFKYSSSNTIDFSIGIHKVTDDWIINSISWYNQPTFDAIPEDTILSTSSKNIWLYWDITSLLQGWINGSINNYGVVLKDTDEVLVENIIRCYSSECEYEADITKRPKLEITYYEP